MLLAILKHMYIHTYINMHIHACIHTIHTDTQTYRNMHIHTCKHTYIPYIHIYIHTHTYIYIIYTCINLIIAGGVHTTSFENTSKKRSILSGRSNSTSAMLLYHVYGWWCLPPCSPGLQNNVWHIVMDILTVTHSLYFFIWRWLLFLQSGKCV